MYAVFDDFGCVVDSPLLLQIKREVPGILATELFIIIHDGSAPMAGTPTEEPERFVCMNCHIISAGLPAEGNSSSDQYEPPVECGACGRDDFVEFAQFHRAYTQRT